MRACYRLAKLVLGGTGQCSVTGAVVYGGVLLALVCSALPAWADTLVITNITGRPGFTPKVVQLSDLIVYGTDQFGPPQTIVYLKPRDSSDDVFVNVGSKITIDVPFPIAKYEISETVNGKEQRSVYLHLRSFVRPTTAMLTNTATGDALVLADDESSYTTPPAPGTVLSFVNGTNASFPDWFVGTSLDESTGDVSGAFTGDVTVDATDLEVDVVPEPATLALLGSAGFVGLLTLLRRRFRLSSLQGSAL